MDNRKSTVLEKPEDADEINPFMLQTRSVSVSMKASSAARDNVSSVLCVTNWLTHLFLLNFNLLLKITYIIDVSTFF